MHHRYAVIMAGGVGERFWPTSRRSRPKQLLHLTSGNETLLEEAVNRIEPLVERENILIATGTALEGPIRATGLLPDDQIIVEPAKRNTLGCLVWVAANLIAKHGLESDITIAVLTADHRIGDPDVFRQTVGRALETAEMTSSLVTIGIPPTRPDTGYGYIELGDGHRGGPFRVVGFREKPNLATAIEFLQTGRFLWNSGMFFWTLSTFLEEMKGADPDSHQIILETAADLQAGRIEFAKKRFEDLPDRPIDIALMERARNVSTIRATFDWDDLGSWDALERSFPPDPNRNVFQGKVIATDTSNTIVVNESDLLVTTLALHDMIVIVTADALLVCPKDQAQRVREIVALVPEDKR